MQFKTFLEQIIDEEAILNLDNIGIYYSTRDDLVAIYELNDNIKSAIDRNDLSSFIKNFKILGVMFFADLSPTKIYEIIKVASENGYGPLLYLLAMQLSEKGLMPDPKTVSDQAKNIWKNFYDGKGKHLVTPIATVKNIHQEPYLKFAYKNVKQYNIMPLIALTDKIAKGRNNYTLAKILHHYIDSYLLSDSDEI